MINVQRKTLSISLLLIATIGLSACSATSKVTSFLNDRADIDYQNNRSVKDLEVPPDLTAPEFDKSFDLPKGVISAVSLKNGGSGVIQTNDALTRKGDLASIKTVADRTVLQVNDTFPRAVILTEIMLTRIGFSVVSKSPSGDVITAKYNGKNISATDAGSIGWKSRLESMFSSSNAKRISANQALVNGKTYRVSIVNTQGSPIVRFARADNTNISDAAHAKIISLLNTVFNS